MAHLDVEKPLDTRLSNVSGQHSSFDKEAALDPAITDATHDRRIIRRVDWHVLPWLAALYAWSLIDRTNMGNARIEGMAAELGLNIGARYSIALLVFFPFYFIVELPATLLIRRIQPRIFIATIAVLWGLVMLCMGFVKSWQALAACRAVLGALEGGFFPACTYLIASWYCRYELQKRISAFYMMGVLASGLSSILAYGLARIGPRGNYRPWSFIFFIEGAITLVLGVISYFFIVDFPQKTKRTFLTPSDQARVVYRINKDRDDVEEDPLTMRKLGKYLVEWKPWVFSIMFMSSTVTAYALSFFLPTILLFRFGFSLVQAQCLAAPPYVFAILVAMTTATLSDKFKLRYPFIIFHSCLCLIGLGLLYGSNIVVGVQYFAVFLVAAGTNANIPATIGYMQNNIHTNSRRATLSALQVGFGAIGGIFGSLVFRQQDSPAYKPGLLACMLCNVFIILATCLFTVLFTKRNRDLDENGTVLEGKVGFRYAI